MCAMSKASEISANVFLGPTPDPALESSYSDEHTFDVLIETSDLAHLPDDKTLDRYRSLLHQSRHPQINFEFPSSGSIMPPSWSTVEADGLMKTVKWIYSIANPQGVTDEDSMELDCPAPAKKVLIHCTDGYTESSLLGLTYFMYAEGLPVHEAWIRLHRDKGRNFFAYPTDVNLLRAIQPRILQESPRWNKSVFHMQEPSWMDSLDGSLPSRILPYMYLGNLSHANNPQLLRELGITRVLSVGETITWDDDMKCHLDWPAENFLSVDRVQDNGVDPLWGEFDRCLKFIGKSAL